MNRDEILAMARSAGLQRTNPGEAVEVVHFAALVAAKEREACAKVCDKALESIWEYHSEDVKTTARNVCVNLAGGIRARGDQS